MVLPQRVGKRRSFGVVVLLYLVTFGIYGLVWNYKAHHEVFRQFELDREGKEEGMVWFILGIVLLQPLFWVYQYGFVRNVAYVRARLGRQGGLRPGGFLGMAIPGSILLTIGFVMLVIGVVFVNIDARPDDPATPDDETITDAQAERMNRLGTTLATLGGLMAMGGAALALSAYGRLQGALNQIWDDYDTRVTWLQSARPAPRTDPDAGLRWEPVPPRTPPRP